VWTRSACYNKDSDKLLLGHVVSQLVDTLRYKL